MVKESCLVTSNKGSLGHTLGAAGALESVFSVLSLVEVFHFEQRVFFFLILVTKFSLLGCGASMHQLGECRPRLLQRAYISTG